MPLSFEIVAECPHTHARAGVLHTNHGVVETPVFMPVGTQGSVKGLSQRDLSEDLGVRILLANTYHLFLRPGTQLIRELGGVHRFISWPHAILTDSGGYQVFSLSGLRKISEHGVVFQSHLDGALHTFTPQSTVDAQLAFGSDILMVLDECPEYPVSHEYARESMQRTLNWARLAFAHYKNRQKSAGESACHTAEMPGALFPIVQGSMFPDLRRRCAEELVTLDADGYAIGGLSVGEPRPLSMETVEATEEVLPRERPRYAMGVGMPAELPEYVARGVDMMDCVLPSRNARNGCLFTSRGRLIVKHARYKNDSRPPDEACRCYTCTGYSRAYLRHLFLSGELLYAALATRHNVHRYLDIMREIRQAIISGEFHEYLKAVRSVSALESENDAG
ncbi:MAG: tRNA guanosine(34) transglycosylase Tgt [Acidobacteriia bacterium]|nr:tRNA guanosine(34) transglycosylase Tgt [Terriglobia bacterium]